MAQVLNDCVHGFSQLSVQVELTNESSDSYSDSECSESLSASSSEFTDDANSLSSLRKSTSLLSDSRGPLFQLSSLMDELPIKRGLSKFYEGKSQSFTSLAEAKCIDDVVKKQKWKRMKTCKSLAGRVGANRKSCLAPSSYSRIITKKASKV